MQAVSPLVDKLRDFGLGRTTRAKRPRAQEPPPQSDDELRLRLGRLMDRASKELRPTSQEQDAMLDLARIYDLFVREWERPGR